MGESARVSRRVLGPGSQGRRLRRAPGGLGRRCGGAGVVEQTQLRQARGGRSGSERPRGESFPVPASVGAVPRGCGRGGGRGGRAGWSGAPCAPVLPRCSEVRAEGARTPIPPQAPLPARWGAADAAWECSRCRSPPPHPGPGSPPAGGAGPWTPSRLTSSEAHTLHTPRERAWLLRGSLSPNRGLQQSPPPGLGTRLTCETPPPPTGSQRGPDLPCLPGGRAWG